MAEADFVPRALRCDVLVLDDVPFVRVAVASTLLDAGYTTCEAANGTAAFAILERVRCRILLTDVMLGPHGDMPDGRDVAAEAMRLYPGLCVIYTSATPAKLDFGRPLTMRERVLPKLHRPRALFGAVEALLGTRHIEVATVAQAQANHGTGPVPPPQFIPTRSFPAACW